MSSPTAGRWMKLYGSLIDGAALSLTRDARLLGIEAEAWSDDNETDGFIPTAAIGRISDSPGLQAAADALVDAGRWSEHPDGWRIAGFVDRHGTSEEREADRELAAARLRGYRAHTKGRHNPDGPGTCDQCRALKRSTYGSTNGAEAKRSDSEAKLQGGNARPLGSGYASASGLAHGARGVSRRQWTAEERAAASVRAKADYARRKVEAEARAQEVQAEKEQARQRAVEAQQQRDAEWIALGGPESALPVSADKLWQRKNPGRPLLR
jgi:hypothetical protein